MPRFEIPGDPIKVVYGYEDCLGLDLPSVFLQVYDNRLTYSGNASQEVNKVTEKVGFRDGGGCYFGLHTGKMGFGPEVDDETMVVYLKRFGVTEVQIELCLWSCQTRMLPAASIELVQMHARCATSRPAKDAASVGPEPIVPTYVKGRSGRFTRYFALCTLFPANQQGCA